VHGRPIRGPAALSAAAIAHHITERMQAFTGRSTATESSLLGPAKSTGAAESSFNFSGKPFSTSRNDREHELTSRGCGIHPRVYPKEEPLHSDAPLTARSSLRLPITAIAQQGGVTPRGRLLDTDTAHLRHRGTRWHQADRERSTCDRRELHALKVAGVNSAQLACTGLRPCERWGENDRPHGMAENNGLPGSWRFTPAGSGGEPSQFCRTAHFTAGFKRSPW